MKSRAENKALLDQALKALESLPPQKRKELMAKGIALQIAAAKKRLRKMVSPLTKVTHVVAQQIS